MATIFNPADLYDVGRVGTDYVPNIGAAVAAGAAYANSNNIPSALEKNGSAKVLVWIIDLQKDFVFTPAMGATLSVDGAIESAARGIKFIVDNTHLITGIAASLDTHVPFQIFYPTWWINQQGQQPPPYTMITSQDIANGVWTPIIEPAWSINYVRELETKGKKTLMIWPFHCMNGSWGHSLIPALSEAIAFHSAARMSQPEFLVKGMIAQTENYSPFEPEVKVPNHPFGNLNTKFLDYSKQFDLIYVMGQARTHCVLEAMRSATKYFANQPDVISKFRFLMDCTDNIQIPELVKAADLEFKRFEQMGVRMVTHAMPIVI